MTESRTSKTNPYPGLRPFQADETHLFFGRDEQRTELLGRLRKSQFLAVVGTSGSGKSSLVRAGLLPGLYGGFMAGGASRWRIVDTRPGGDPIGRLATALDEPGALQVADEDEDDISFTEATLRRSSLGLINVIKEAHLQEGERVLILVDQFEELFRFIDTAHVDGAKDDASAFVHLLLAAAQQDELPIYVVLTMRSDFLGDCARFRSLPEAINDGQYLIPRLTRDQRREAITGPASVAGVTLSPTLVNRLLNDVGDTPDQLPILQHALMRTFDHWQVEHPDADSINLEDYEDVGGMSHALSRHADAVLKGLGENVSPAEGRRRRHIAEKLLKRITDVGKGGRKIRRLAKLKDIAAVAEVSVEEAAAVVEAFRQKSNSFLMPPIGEELQPDSFIDISHESLIRNWTQLDKWVDEEAESAEDYRLLAQKAELHQIGEEDLLGRQALRVANEWKEQQRPTAAWAKRYDADYKIAMDFLAKSDAKVTAQRDARDRKRRITRAVSVGAVIAVATPLMMLLISAGEDVEWAHEIAATRVEFANGRADEKLSDFLESRIRGEEGSTLSAQAAVVNTYWADYYELYDLTTTLENNEATDHAAIVKKYSSWQTDKGERLLDAIWGLRLDPQILIDAMVMAGVPSEELLGKDLDALLDTIYEGSIWITPSRLQTALRQYIAQNYAGSKQFADIDQRLGDLTEVDEPDRWLASIYTALADGRFDLAEFSVAQKLLGAGPEFTLQHDIAENAVFRTLLSRLRTILYRPAETLATHKNELQEMLKIFDYLEVSQVAESDELTGNAGEDGDPDEVAFDESPVMEAGGEQGSMDGPEQPPTIERRIGRSIVKLGIPELERRFDGVPAPKAADQGSGNSDEGDETRAIKSHSLSQEERRKIAFVWTVKKLTEEPLSDEALKELRGNKIASSLAEAEVAPFTLWKLQDNELYKTLEKSNWFIETKQAIVDLYGVLLFALLWFVWSGLRRGRARKGKPFAAHVGLIRLGLASLVDGFVAFVVGAILATSVGFVGALVFAAGFDTFDYTEEVLGFSFAIVGSAVMVGYLLLRDILHFRYRRSLGKILFEFRPIDNDGNPLRRGASVRRNWTIFIGIVVAAIVVSLSIAILAIFDERVLDLEVREQLYLFLAIGFSESVLLLGLFEKIGGRWSKTTVIDTRSKDPANAGSSQPSGIAPLPAST